MAGVVVGTATQAGSGIMADVGGAAFAANDVLVIAVLAAGNTYPTIDFSSAGFDNGTAVYPFTVLVSNLNLNDYSLPESQWTAGVVYLRLSAAQASDANLNGYSTGTYSAGVLDGGVSVGWTIRGWTGVPVVTQQDHGNNDDSGGDQTESLSVNPGGVGGLLTILGIAGVNANGAGTITLPTPSGRTDAGTHLSGLTRVRGTYTDTAAAATYVATTVGVFSSAAAYEMRLDEVAVADKYGTWQVI